MGGLVHAYFWRVLLMACLGVAHWVLFGDTDFVQTLRHAYEHFQVTPQSPHPPQHPEQAPYKPIYAADTTIAYNMG